MLKYFKNAETWKYLTKIILLICTHRIQLMVILYKAVVWCLYDSITEVLFCKDKYGDTIFKNHIQ